VSTRLQAAKRAGLVLVLVASGVGGVLVSQAAAGSSKPADVDFALFANSKFAPCLAEDTDETPTVKASVDRGDDNDTLKLKLRNFKPGLDFDLFTVQRSPQRADGTPDPTFPGFGMAWYQSDIHVGDHGSADVKVKTILLDQIFGFDPDVNLAPTNTFHLGFWFNDPHAAAPCGFTGTTPFNGEHAAGPLAFITRPDATTKLGPLCSDPEGTTGRCNP